MSECISEWAINEKKCEMTRIDMKIHSYCLSVCFVEMPCSSVCYKVRLSNGIVIVCSFVSLKCSVRLSVTKSVCMPWRDHDVKKKGGLTI